MTNVLTTVAGHAYSAPAGLSRRGDAFMLDRATAPPQQGSSSSRDKRERFVTLAEKRVNRLLKDIRLLGNLSNKNNYVYTDGDARKIFAALEGELKSVRRKFEGSAVESSNSFQL
jgi:hypothetical protein